MYLRQAIDNRRLPWLRNHPIPHGALPVGNPHVVYSHHNHHGLVVRGEPAPRIPLAFGCVGGEPEETRLGGVVERVVLQVDVAVVLFLV